MSIEPRGKPEIGLVICDCRFNHQQIVAIAEDGDTITLANGFTCSYQHCCDLVPHDWKHPEDEDLA